MDKTVDKGLESEAQPPPFKSSDPTVTHNPLWHLVDEKADKSGPSRTAPTTPMNPAGDFIPPTIQRSPEEQFRLELRIGEGGYGEVWRARQPSLERLVAIKRLRREFYEQPQHARRIPLLESAFRQEAYTTAILDHPSIVPIYAMGTDEEDNQVLAMKLVEGESWETILNRDFKELPPEEYYQKHLAILIDVAQAVAFAHSRGILHRDIKPSQVMVGQYGETYLMDWGLAYIFDKTSGWREQTTAPIFLQSPHHTNPAGTPSYMAPEQTAHSVAVLGPWTDIYLLGATLYYILTNRPPHDTGASESAFRHARLNNIQSPVSIAADRLIPDDLSRIALKAMQRDPKLRFGSTDEFLQELQDYLRGAGREREANALVDESRAMLARDDLQYRDLDDLVVKLGRARTLWPSLSQSVEMLDQAHRLYAMLAIRNGDLVLGRIHAQRLTKEQEREVLLEQVRKAELAQRRVRLQRRYAFVGIAILLLLVIGGLAKYTADQKHAREALQIEKDRVAEALDEAQTSRLDAIVQRDRAENALFVAQREQYYSSISIAEDALDDGNMPKAWDTLLEKSPEVFRDWEWGSLLAGQFPEDLAITDKPMYHADWSPDESQILVAGRGVLRLYDAATGRQLREIPVGNNVIWRAIFSPDGKLIGAGSFDKQVYLVDVESGNILRQFEQGGLVRGLDFSPDGNRLLACSYDKTARLYDVATGNLVRKFAGFKDGPYDVDFHPDGSRFVASSLDDHVRIFDVETGLLSRELPVQPENVLSAVYTTDGKAILTSCTDRYWRLFDAETGDLIREGLNPGTFLHAATISPDGTLIAIGDQNGRCGIWDRETGEEIGHFYSDNSMIKLRFNRDGSRLMATSFDSIRVIPTVKLTGRFRSDPNPSLAALGSPPTRVRVYGVPAFRDLAWQKRDAIWSTPVGATVVDHPSGPVLVQSRDTSLAPDFSHRALLDIYTGHVVLQKYPSEEIIDEWNDAEHVYTRFSPDGNYLAVARSENLVRVLKAPDWREVALLEVSVETPITEERLKYYTNGLAFSPDSSRLAVPYLNGSVIVWDVENRIPHREMEKGQGAMLAAVFNSNGTLLAAGGSGREVYIWNPDDGRLVQTLVGHQNSIFGMAFHPDGRRLASFASDNTVRIWDVETGRELLVPYVGSRGASPLGLGFDQEGRRLYFATSDGRTHCIDSFPWNLDDYPGPPDWPFQKKLELYKRQLRLGAFVTPEDIE